MRNLQLSKAFSCPRTLGHKRQHVFIFLQTDGVKRRSGLLTWQQPEIANSFSSKRGFAPRTSSQLPMDMPTSALNNSTIRESPHTLRK